MRIGPVLLFSVITLYSPTFAAEPRVDAANAGERIILVVPVIGSGSYADPKRPMLTPAVVDPHQGTISAYNYELSDNGQFAIVQFKMKDRDSANALLGDARVLKGFLKNRDDRRAMEPEVQRLKRNFSLDEFVRRLR